ncbi:conserved hypothetical protein [Trichormus variabilis ATCC 29413]|uniref:Uncharacterized protein n=2 Tax=Anabaena variabilis TaxID=264691 RepID=Q3MBQ8_TRIV2|nr:MULTISPECIES: hypothetical protein [Nostocaceae]ABA21578.1 conserved hypothetical protein [Trichormus variabilis ATCC 29413]MBC1214539.1 hypothetical protein [Trichormus variabilis ARAD]MBC1256872.1 hypothetical protein [Trichormus variabilis V5]MBC1266226.1 hypothetical protein [Trichormus variabilis FSR]MBC1301629.1 hypothetical protein [Trichormus variabilis N2B]
MFLLLSRVLLWLLIGIIVYSLFQRVYPSSTFVGRIILVIILVVLALSFINPNEPAVRSLWDLVSFPLKPLGGSLLLLIFAAQRIKGGGIEKPGGYLAGWALTILLLSSMPFINKLLGGTLATTSVSLPSQTLVALQPSSNNITDIGSNILYSAESGQTTIALNSLNSEIPSYLLQTPAPVANRTGLTVSDFVPSADTLQQTTRFWESYLNQIYFFLRGRQS